MELVIVKEEEVKRKRRLYGHLCTLSDGQIIYLARRKHAQVFRSGHATISSAMMVNEAAWAMDEVTLYNLRAKGVKVVGVRVTDTGDLYLTRLANFLDLKKAKMRDYSATGGARQRYLPMEHFVHKRGTVELATPV